MASTFDLRGITGNTLQIGAKTGGPLIKNSSGTIQLRDSSDSAYASLAGLLRPPAGTASVALPCHDYGIGGINQVRAIVNGFEQTITMTAGGVARQTFAMTKAFWN